MKISSEKLETLSQPNKHTHKHTHLKRKKKNLLVLIFNHFLNWGKKNTIMKVNTPVPPCKKLRKSCGKQLFSRGKRGRKRMQKKKKNLGRDLQCCNPHFLLFAFQLCSSKGVPARHWGVTPQTFCSLTALTQGKIKSIENSRGELSVTGVYTVYPNPWLLSPFLHHHWLSPCK